MKNRICDDSLDILQFAEKIEAMTDEEFENYLTDIKQFNHK